VLKSTETEVIVTHLFGVVGTLFFDFGTSDDDKEDSPAHGQDSQSGFKALQLEPLEDLNDWANDLINEAFGATPVPRILALQCDKKPFHELFD
jgi:hypothetical protein